ncbi:MAG: glycosyltransferase family 2 protein [Deltaproteobacteria bacterium]|nr:glycosyltransferase family 2 protein [Deltaproteobacteria bacterium]
MNTQSSFVIVIAAFNAATTIASVLRDLNNLYPDAPKIVVDDGSSDGTGEIAIAEGARLITHPTNMGSGAAFKSGLRCSLGYAPDCVVTLGADNQRDPVDIQRMITALEKDPQISCIIGSKYAMRNDVPFARRCGGMALTFIFRILFPSCRHLTDVLSGFRAIRPEYVPLLLDCPDRYDFEAACCCLMASKGLRIGEIPVTVRYHSESTRMRWPLFEGVRIALRMLSLRIIKMI